MKTPSKAALIVMLFGLFFSGCARQVESQQAVSTPTSLPAAPTNQSVQSTLRGNEQPTSVSVKDAEPIMLPGPNAVPADTRIVVNIPAFRMDVFCQRLAGQSHTR